MDGVSWGRNSYISKVSMKEGATFNGYLQVRQGGRGPIRLRRFGDNGLVVISYVLFIQLNKVPYPSERNFEPQP